MNRLKGIAAKATQMSLPSQLMKKDPEPVLGKDKYKNYYKTGPELFITKVLMINGPLASKQIWRIYQRQLHQAKAIGNQADIQYWPSLTKMKLTLKFMRINEKIKGNGYNPKSHHFQGWKIQEKRALKYVHPTVVQEIKDKIAKRDNL